MQKKSYFKLSDIKYQKPINRQNYDPEENKITKYQMVHGRSCRGEASWEKRQDNESWIIILPNNIPEIMYT